MPKKSRFGRTGTLMLGLKQMRMLQMKVEKPVCLLKEMARPRNQPLGLHS